MTDQDDKKPREWWASIEDVLMKNKSGGLMHIAHTAMKNPKKDDIHVIEKSAYDELARKLEAAEDEIVRLDKNNALLETRLRRLPDGPRR